MPISDLPARDLARMTSQQLADLILAADRERRRARDAGNYDEAAQWERESTRLAAVLNREPRT